MMSYRQSTILKTAKLHKNRARTGRVISGTSGRWTLAALLLTMLCLAKASAAPAHKTENVFLIVSDGLRWQEVFNGAEDLLMNKTNGGVKHLGSLQTNYWRATAEARRAALFPFFWGKIAKEGQLYGNQTKGSIAKVLNDKRFSYPGYNEMLSGAPDARVKSNDKIPNPNLTVFEWLHEQPRFRTAVVAFGTWDVFPYIFNCDRSRIPIWPAWEPKFEYLEVHPPQLVGELMHDTTPLWDDMILDSFQHRAVLDYVKRKKPRLAFVGYGETDNWAHEGRYDLYLESANHADQFVQQLWETVQRIPQYHDKTTFIVTADHGRGSGVSGWKDHGEKQPASDGIWLAIIGPDTPSLGERTNVGLVTQSQIAATIAALLGEDYNTAAPKAGRPIADVIEH
jgi:hypothetical protein